MIEKSIHIGRRELLLLLVGIDDGASADGIINGITRLQKYLYLLQAEWNVEPTTDGYQFTAYKAGPYSPKVYDDLELLENLGLVKAQPIAESSPIEVVDLEKLNFEDLICEGEFGDTNGESAQNDSFEEKRFALTPSGKEKVQKMLSDEAYQPYVEKIRKVKSKFSHYSLSDLLYYVYTRHPDMTTESEIIDRVMGRN